ncbi:hypothetical protein LXA43DRAFT_1037252 [Ganoderma leucocontextum]|nr:hypothetical protein LXA43DRAFT_1037252 [Ganoderma leucocontextum]
MWEKLLSLVKLAVGLCILIWRRLSADPITIRFFIAHAPRTFGPHQVVHNGSFQLIPKELNLTHIQEAIRRVVEQQDLPDCDGFPDYADLRIFRVTAEGGLDDMTRFEERLSRKDAQSLRENSPIPLDGIDVAAIYVDHIIPQIPSGVNLAQGARDQTIHRAKWAPAPSEIAKDVKGRLRNALNDHLVVMGRPSDDTAPDPSIFSPPSAYLSQALNEPRPVPDAETLDAVTELFSVSAAIYDSEAARYNAIAPVVGKLFGVDLVPQLIVVFDAEERHPAARSGHKRQRRDPETPPGGRADAVVQTDDLYPVLVFELKKELGLAGVADLQVAVTHMKIMAHPTRNFVRDNTPCATILLSVSGTAMCIAYGMLGDVYLSKPIDCDSGHQWFPLVGTTPAQRRANIYNLASIVPAVRQAIRKLRSTPPRPAPYLPDPTPANPSGQMCLRELQFRDRLSRDPSRSLFRATYQDQSVLVKFCDDYNRSAHDRLARHNLAPELHCVENLVGGLKMVVMAFDPEMTSAYDKYFGRDLPPSLMAEVDRALAILHDGGDAGEDSQPVLKLVHGDVRRENILVPRNPDQATPIRLVGFRWSGVAGQARYPCDLFSDEVRGKLEGPRANGPILVGQCATCS